MERRITINILLSFVLVPIIMAARDYYFIVILKDHTFFYGTFWEYETSELLIRLVITPLFWLIFFMLPYNLIILKKEKKRRLRFYEKVLYFELLLMIAWFLLGVIENLWSHPFWKNLNAVLYFIPPSLLFAGLVHLFVDRKEARHPSE